MAPENIRTGDVNISLTFGVGTHIKRVLVVYDYAVVLLVAPCIPLYKRAPKTNLSIVLYVYVMVLLLASCTSMYKQALKQTYF